MQSSAGGPAVESRTWGGAILLCRCGPCASLEPAVWEGAGRCRAFESCRLAQHTNPVATKSQSYGFRTCCVWP